MQQQQCECLSLILLTQVYAMAKVHRNNPEYYDAYLVRFDSDRFEYLAKLPEFSYSATFDRITGDFFLLDQMDDKRRLYRYSDVHHLEGFTDKNNAPRVDTDYVYDYSDCTAPTHTHTDAKGDVLDEYCDVLDSGEK